MKIIDILESDDLFNNLPADDLNSLIQKSNALRHHSSYLKKSFLMLHSKYEFFGGVASLVMADNITMGQQYLRKGFKYLNKNNSLAMYRDIPELIPVVSRLKLIQKAIEATEAKWDAVNREISKIKPSAGFML